MVDKRHPSPAATRSLGPTARCRKGRRRALRSDVPPIKAKNPTRRRRMGIKPKVARISPTAIFSGEFRTWSTCRRSLGRWGVSTLCGKGEEVCVPGYTVPDQYLTQQYFACRNNYRKYYIISYTISSFGTETPCMLLIALAWSDTHDPRAEQITSAADTSWHHDIG